ncbi:hypothetical protein Val02_23600 [Virgisporangium aliadipatigenens]|uniref:Carbohydrate kinase PfkB domain-containing protein n=1 Tax=Virgisporangium aliadipatigenens TaxID=741659 RepID=A0A8J4DPF6_9ACTN|nr:PfkB family carbohydrate kinase [Virgisporangium aliadipatigenens]GIJ45474.1 hypothetical protein Val02_23600 [Virgisporangium aliadipatigenens]
MILTVTLNPALDITYGVDTLTRHGTHRVRAVAARPGGKGLNVAGVLRQLGEPVHATGLLGGATGAEVAGLLDGVPHTFTPIAGTTRRTVTVVDGDATGFWEPGPAVTADEWLSFVDAFAALLRDAAVVVLSGSVPPGVPADGYAALVVLARQAGVPVILDADGDPLRHGLAAGPDVVKPNAAELAGWLAAGAQAPPGPPHAPDPPDPPHERAPATARPTSQARAPADGTARDPATRSHPDAAPDSARRAPADGPAVRGGDVRPAAGGSPVPAGDGTLDAARRMRAAGAGAVIATRGAEGLLAVTDTGAWRAAPPEPVPGNPTGAGDACTAAIARGLLHGTPWPEVLADAVALSAAAVAEPVAGSVHLPTYRRLRSIVLTEEC